MTVQNEEYVATSKKEEVTSADFDDTEFDFEPPVRKTVPPYARRVPRRTWVLAGISVVSVFLYSVMLATLASIDTSGATDPNAGFFSPWRLNVFGQIFLWVFVISGAASLFTWLQHVRDREQVALWMAARAKMARNATTPKRAPQR